MKETCICCHIQFEKECGVLVGNYCRNCIAKKAHEQEDGLIKVLETIETFTEDGLEGLDEEAWQILGRLITIRF